MYNNEKKIYCYKDKIFFHKCDLADDLKEFTSGDCTNYQTIEDGTGIGGYYRCRQDGIHFHCSKHIEQELQWSKLYNDRLECPICGCDYSLTCEDDLIQTCKKLLNAEKFKNAKLIRLDDWYVPEVKEKKKEIESDYWISTEVKTDKDKETIIIIYIGKKGVTGKSQIFIKPEKLQLTHDHKDLDPATIISQIEVTLKDRTLTQKYDGDKIQ